MEAACDYNLFFWHLSYGYAGTMNDITILDNSPLLERYINGSFQTVEMESGIVPYKIGNETFQNTFLLCDGIYPDWSRFVKAIKEPTTENEKKFTSWQESARKDIERAFGVLKCQWQFLDRPIHLHDIQVIADRVTCCWILHNILVSDRVMGDCRARYVPDEHVQPMSRQQQTNIQQPHDLDETQNRRIGEIGGGVGIATYNSGLSSLFAREDRFKQVTDTEASVRLLKAIMDTR